MYYIKNRSHGNGERYVANTNLLVEDDNQIVATMTEFLRVEGFLVENVSGQKEAVEKIESSVVFEALYVSAVGIPIGVVTGIAGIGITLLCIRGILNQITQNFESLGKMNLFVSWQAILITIAAALITVFISAFIPMIRISRLSAADAVKQKNDISIKKRNVKCSKLFYKIFGFEGMLARKNFKRSRKKYRITVFSLFVSIVLFISANSFCKYMTKGLDDSYKVNKYQIKYEGDSKVKSDTELIEKIRKAENVKRAAVADVKSNEVKINQNDTTKGYQEYNKKIYSDGYLAYGDNEESIIEDNVCIYAVDDDTYRNYLEENKISVDEYMSIDNPKMIAYAKYRSKDGKTGRVTVGEIFNKDSVQVKEITLNSEKFNKLYDEKLAKYDTNDEKQIEEYQKQYKTIREQCLTESELNIGMFVDELAFCVDNYDYYSGFVVMCSESQYDYMMKQEGIEQTDTGCIYIDTNNHIKAYEEVQKIVAECGHEYQGKYTGKVVDVVAEYESEQGLMLIIKIFSYGFTRE